MYSLYIHTCSYVHLQPAGYTQSWLYRVLTCSWVSILFLLLIVVFLSFPCGSETTSGWVGGRSYTPSSDTLASSTPSSDFSPGIREQIPEFFLERPKTEDTLGLFATASFCVRSLLRHFSTLQCKDVAGRLALQALVVRGKLLPLFLTFWPFAWDPSALEVLLKGAMDEYGSASASRSVLCLWFSLLAFV